jgi:hypothetical protein
MSIDDAGDLGIGLDLATHITGAFEARGDTFLVARLLKAPEVDDRDWQVMASKVCSYLADRPVDYVCFEDTYLKSASVLKKLSFLAGAVRHWCYDHGVPYYVATTAEIDSACGIPVGLKRHKRKPETQAFALRLGFALPEDAADALVTLFWGMSARRQDLILRGEFDGR